MKAVKETKKDGGGRSKWLDRFFSGRSAIIPEPGEPWLPCGEREGEMEREREKERRRDWIKWPSNAAASCRAPVLSVVGLWSVLSE